MATLTALDVISRVNDILQDTLNVRWPAEELLRYINDAQREVVRVRPDANVKTEAVQLVANETKQTVPAEGIRVIDITRNMGDNGSTPGRAIRLISREVLDAQIPDWHSQVGKISVTHYMFDIRNPRLFYVYPRTDSATPVWVELAYAANPLELTDSSETLQVDDIYANAIIDFVLYRAYSKDADYAANAEMAMSHYQSFVTSLGLKTQVDMSVNPNENIGRDAVR